MVNLSTSTMAETSMKRLANYDATDEPEKKKPRSVPTANEVRCMKETTELHRDFYFRSQMDELLSEVSMSDKHKTQLELWLNIFSKHVKKMKKMTPVDLSDTSNYFDINVPMPLLPGKGEFQFFAPSAVHFSGSYSSGTATDISRVVDIVVEMPQESVLSLDYRNGVWLMKRAHYLASIGLLLKKGGEKMVKEVEWGYHMGEPLRPSLLLTPLLSGKPLKWKVQLLPVPPKDSFPIHAFSPQKTNIKDPNALHHHHLNSLCCIDSLMTRLNETVVTVVSSLPHLADGIKLVKVWLSQRSLYKGRGSFSGFLVCKLALYLYRVRKIGPSMSPYQCFKVILNYLVSEAQWDTEGVNMNLLPTSDTNPYRNTLLPTDEFHNMFDVVFIDSTGYLNLTAFMLRNVFKHLKYEAIHSNRILEIDSNSTFEMLFIKRSVFSLTFDQSIVVTLSNATLKKFYSNPSTKEARTSDLLNQLNPKALDIAAGDAVVMVKDIVRVLEKGLVKRADLVTVRLEDIPLWSLQDKPPVSNVVTLGLKLSPFTAFNLLTKDTENEGEIFQEFWGNLSNLKRFRDGSIIEAVSWGDGSEGAGDCRKIPGKIAKHLLSLHLKVPRKEILHIGPNVENVLRLPTEDRLNYCTGEEMSRAFVETYDKLALMIRKMDLELPVTSVLSQSDCLAHCRTYPRKSSESNNYFEFDAMKVTVMLSQSRKWPTDLEAVNGVKRSFVKKIASNLLKKNINTSLRIDGSASVFLDGFWFLLHITFRGEILLHKKLAAQEFVTAEEEGLGEQDSYEVLQLQINNDILPKLNSALAGIQAQHASYGTCVRLCRKWLSCHMLELHHFPPLITQMLVAQLYINGGEFESPQTPYIGFIRFLFMMATSDWNLTPVFLNVSDFSAVDLKELQSRFEVHRSLYPALYITTPFDIRGAGAGDGKDEPSEHTKHYRYKLASHWTQACPSTNTLKLLKETALQSINNYSLNATNTSFDVKDLFTPSLNFDIEIKLSAKIISKLEENLRFEALIKNPMVERIFNKRKEIKHKPDVYALLDLLQNYSDFVDIFYNENGGETIGLIIKPGAEKNGHKMSLFGGFELTSKEELALFDTEYLVTDIRKNCSYYIQEVLHNKKQITKE